MTLPRKYKRPHNDKYQTKARALRRYAQHHQLPCWICGQAIDYTLDYRQPMSFTADHIHALKDGGKLNGEMRPAHRSCNSRRGASKSNRIVPISAVVTSRKW